MSPPNPSVSGILLSDKFLFSGLSLLEFVLALLGYLAVVFEVKSDLVVNLILVVRVFTVLDFGFVVFSDSSNARGWTHTDILRNKVFSCKVIHEVFSGNETPILVVVFFHKDLVELLVDCKHNLFEFKRHRFISVSTNILVELLVELLDDARTPT